MAYFEFDFPEELFKSLAKMEENTDELQKKMLKKSAPIMVDELKKGITEIGAVDTGELLNSIKARTPSKDKKGVWQVFIGPSGNAKNKYTVTKKGTRRPMTNAAKLVFYEYGTSKQSARPILQFVANACERRVVEKMQQIYNQEVDK